MYPELAYSNMTSGRGLKNTGVASTTPVCVTSSWTANAVMAIIARRPFFTSASLTHSCPSLSSGKTPNGSKPKSPGVYPSFLEAPKMPYKSMAAAPAKQSPQYKGETFPSPPLRTEGARSALCNRGVIPTNAASFLSKSSEIGHPAAANMARRPCLISASRYFNKSSLVLANPRGSKPTSPAKDPSRAAGRSMNGKDCDMVGS
mmetsp:Transcript_22023/g.38797  ORF Transcript_22023/g.38797 Transcript_22023/m.38797 type:complete len:203 (+) Transcript_22023:38-646(+)